MPRSTHVQIFGQSYSINADLDEAYVHKLAAHVDEKMRAIARMAPTLETQKVAVLAALAIADELHGYREEHEESEDLLKERAQRCLALVERALKNSD